jgi:plastocyanin
MKRNVMVVVVGITVVLIVGACGDGHTTHGAETGGRTIEIDMRENDFSPASITVAAGDQIQFVFHNKGSVPHDAFIGDEAAQDAHEREMRTSSGTGHGHDADGVTVEPGNTETLSHTFDKPGTTLIGCHELNHYALGMRIRITVT